MMVTDALKRNVPFLAQSSGSIVPIAASKIDFLKTRTLSLAAKSDASRHGRDVGV